MSDIFGKIFGKDKDKSHKDKGHHSGEKGSTVVNTAKWNDFCEYFRFLTLFSAYMCIVL